jgi:nucleotidyltransferase substrate binding protein (TIGR01987 family)
MGDIALDLKPLTQAIARLGEGIARYEQNIADTQIRDGLVQRFEFTYEISHKTLKRYLEMASPAPDAFDEMPFQDLIRTANEQNLLLSDWPRWRKFREMRGKTSHTYDEAIALEVVAEIPAFLAEATQLRDRLQARLS